MRHFGYFVLFLSLVGIHFGTRRTALKTAPAASQEGIVHAQDFVPIPPGH